MRLPMLMKFVACLIFGLIVTGHGEVCAAEKLVLQLPWHHQFQFAGYYMAEEKGYYRDLGFDVEILAVNRTDNPVETVLAGQADFGVSGSGLLIERSLGKPVVAVAAILQQDPTVFLALERSGIRKISDLAGKRVMLAPGGKSLPLVALLHQEKLLDEIELLKTSYDFKSLLNGEADVFNGYSTNEPYLLEELGYPVHIVDPKDYGIHFYGDILFTSEKFVETRPQVVEDFRKASLKGWDYALNHPEETIEVIRSLYHVDKTVQSLQFEAAAIKQAIQPGQIELGTMDRTRWAQITQHLIASGPLPASFQLSDDFLYHPPQGLNRDRLIPWAVGVLVGFAVLLVFLSFLSRANIRLSQTRRKLEEEIREREQAEKKVQGSAKLLRDALNAVSDGIWEWNVQSGEVKLDTRSKELFGLDPETESLDAADIFRGIDSASVPGIIKDIQNHTEGRTDHFDHEFQVNLPDGKARWIRGRGRIIDRDSDRNALWIIGTNVDITERKLAEQERLKTETRFRELIEKVAEIGIQGYDEDRKVIFWNKASEELYGYTEEEALGHRLENLIIPDFMREDVVRLHHEWVAGGAEIPAGELVLIGKSGEDVPVFSSHVMQETSSGKVMYCIDVDLRPLQRAEQKRQELEEQLRQVYKMEAIGTMAGGIAHDFNNSLAIILGNVELSALKVPGDSPVAGHLQQAKTAILRARDLVQQILIYSRQGIQNFKPVQISMILDEALKLMRSTIPSTVELKFSVPEECRDLNISADSTQLQQILINLCNNAVHAMEEKGRLQVSLGSVDLEADALPAGRNLPVGPYVKLRVEDSGKGMSVEILGKVFDPFFTTKGVGEGTGMGLSVVHGIVESHGGFITAESTVGAGSVFEVFFPIVQADGVAPLPVVDTLPKGNERIIFVDDEETLVDVGRQMLTEHGYRVTAETSSRKALELFQLNPDQFDLVITDQTMPGLTGTELAVELLKIKPDLPIIICTGYSARVSADEAKQIGIREFCMKPLNLSQLIQATRKALDAAVQEPN